MPKKKDSLKYMVEEVWPKTKKELERGIASTKKILNKSEKYLKKVSDQGVAQTTKLSLGLKKEKLYYDLGKTIARTSPAKWVDNKRIKLLLRQIRSLDSKIAKIK